MVGQISLPVLNMPHQIEKEASQLCGYAVYHRPWFRGSRIHENGCGMERLIIGSSEDK